MEASRWSGSDAVGAGGDSQNLARSSGRRDPYTFKRKGNENQFHFNQDVKDAFVELSAGLKKVNADDLGERGKLGLQKANCAAEEGMSLIARRQKLLKLANRSEWGWAVVEEYVEEYVEDDLVEEYVEDDLVEEYVEDDLVEDSGDEKRIERVELHGHWKEDRSEAKGRRAWMGPWLRER